MTARVLNIRHCGSDDGVFIGRPSKWGNPFVTSDRLSRDKAIALHRKWLLEQPDLVAAAKRELRGKNLICYCAPKPCHGDVLLEIANEP